ncbi:MAG TPA: MATE family efflux transporter [Clostridia bacterium]
MVEEHCKNINTTLSSEDINFNDLNLSLRKSIISFSWPCMIELLLVSLVSVVSLIMVGHLGAYAISAVGITTQPVFICISAFQALNIGSTTLVSRFIGAKDIKSARIVVSQTIIISVISGLIFSLLGYVFSNNIVKLMGAQPDTIYYATVYMKYMALGVVFQSVPTAVSALLRGAGYSKPSMYFNIISNVINIVLGIILIYGFYKIPSMGIEGAGIAATISKIVACVISVIVLLGKDHLLKISVKELKIIDFIMIKRILMVGLGAAGEQLVLRFGILVFTRIVADLGTVPNAAHQISINIIGLTYNICQPFGIASASFVGINLGAGRLEMAKKYTAEIRKIGFIVSVFVSIFLFLFSGQIASLYTNEPDVISFSRITLKIIALIMPAQSSQLVITGGLRGAGDTRWPLISTTCGILGIRMILGAVFVKVFMWGLTGAWIAVAIDQFVRSAVVFLRYRYGNWQHIEI